MTASEFMRQQPDEVQQEFIGFFLAKLTLKQVVRLSELTGVPVSELVLEYGFGAQAIYTNELEGIIHAQHPGSVLGVVAHIE